ncbi:uncharacterized protein [Arachis hypogaea]|uniref:uncharacterized protein n=1 Tax=Arachis hypogaea TaxID=3818 RepID=UPI003B21554B
MQGLVDAHLSTEEVLQNIGDGDNSEEEDDTDDPDYEADSDMHFSDSEDDYCGDDGLFDVDITLGEMHQDIRKSKKSKSAVEKLKKTQKVAAGKRKSSRLSDDEGLNSDELEEVSSEDDEASKKKFPVHKELKDMSKYKWEAGTLYATREEFKEAVTSYAVHTGRNIKFPVVDNVRVRAKCGDGCEWFAYAVKMTNEDSWQLRTVNDHHSCNTVFDIKVMKSKWLAKVFRRKVEENPKLKLGTIQSRTLRKWNVQISRAKAFRAKQIALVDINGTFREQYRRLYDYCHELLRTNPGSSVKLHVQLPPAAQTEHPDTTVDLSPRFHRIYICLKACKESFMKCRPMIGLDGCFLKTPYGRWLLVALGWDPNDQMLPIAYAVVEAETKDSWTWFLSNLIDDIGADKLLRSTFMSDQQKSCGELLQHHQSSIALQEMLDLLAQCIRVPGWPVLQQGLIPNQMHTKNFSHQDQLEFLGATLLQLHRDNPHHKGVRLRVLSQGLSCVTSCVWCLFWKIEKCWHFVL